MNHAVILFDGVCSFCNGSVQFILNRDDADRFRFCSLQSAAGQALLAHYQLPNDLQSLAVIDAGKVYLQSDAVLRICKQLGGAWKLLYVFRGIPKWARDPVYRMVANNRYRWFGKQETCMIPSPEVRAKFLDLD
ncbi:thiol-disulfide oxidoreductase [Ammoniphilus oxalaticus]|uniref:Thiol-disulfide oxidoreductase n=1 Tax=Ammoniphilus oxalaticus TaxID=66863 RepID=A0A419SLW1_9BACL|nr:thiol-disulfide oxidoreductase DCC family protein [Ammoniphilus oxalaticus]RKD25049.1 thiol-disulfide oxidoreductase [Ammoniphilus oxalaticus]